MDIEGLATKVVTAYIQSSVNSVTEESQLLRIITEVTSAFQSLQSED
jgi:predicted transcriptional regulator